MFFKKESTNNPMLCDGILKKRFIKTNPCFHSLFTNLSCLYKFFLYKDIDLKCPKAAYQVQEGILNMKKILMLLIILISSSAEIFAYEMRFFPSEKITTNPHAALLRSPAFEVLYMASAQDKKNYMAYNFATKFGVLYIRSADGIEYEFSGYGGAFTRFQLFSESFNFVHADFLGGGVFDIKYKSLTFENMIYHNSSHTGDDYIHYDDSTYKNTGFEAVKHYTTLNVFSILDTSLGLEYKFGRRPENTIFYNKSVFIGNRVNLLSTGIPVFFEWEIEIFNLMRYSPNFGVRLGVYLDYLFNVVFAHKAAAARELHEFSIYYYYGYSKQGYFYNKRESLFLFGPAFRF